MNQSNLAIQLEQATALSDLVLDEKKREELDLVDHELFLVEVHGEEFGPVWFRDLQDFIITHDDLYSVGKVKRLTEDSWETIGHHPLFQRRSPRIVKNEPKLLSEKNQYFLIQNGSPVGPFTYEKLSSMLDEKELIYSDLVSLNNGDTWIKIYEVDGLDRRGSSKEHLPTSPENNIFRSSTLEVIDDLDSNNPKLKEKDAIAGLAFIGRLKSGKVSDDLLWINSSKNSQSEQPIEPLSVAEDIDQSEKIVPKYSLKKLLIGAGTLFFLLFLGMAITQFFNENASEAELGATKPVTFKEKTLKIKNDGKSVVKNSQTNEERLEARRASLLEKRRSANSSRSARTAKRSPPRSRKSFIESETYINNQKSMSDNPEIDSPNDTVYDNGSGSVELDPVRSRLDRETIDGSGGFDGDRGPAFIEEEVSGELRAPEQFESEGPVQEEGVFEEEVSY